jgi:hypothetical protein
MKIKAFVTDFSAFEELGRECLDFNQRFLRATNKSEVIHELKTGLDVVFVHLVFPQFII